jgi:hypothetical protein
VTAAAVGDGSGHCNNTLLTVHPLALPTICCRFNDISSCAIPSDSTVTPTLSGGVKITNKDFDAGCVCKSTGRKPVLNLITTDVLVGQQCLA